MSSSLSANVVAASILSAIISGTATLRYRHPMTCCMLEIIGQELKDTYDLDSSLDEEFPADTGLELRFATKAQ